MDGIMGAGPIGDMGRAVERATANMSPDQKQEYLRQAALNGIDPRVNNIALLQVMSMQLDRLKQPQAQPPQGGTVRQQLNQAVMMKDRQEQEAALRAQIAEAMQRRAAEREMAMDRGVGGLDAGTMENPSFAGGGMVAFAGGGKLSDPYGVGYDPTDPNSIAAFKAGQIKGGLGSFADKRIAELQALRRRYGVGEGSEYDTAMQEEIARLQEQAAGYGERAGREDLASYFFNVAAEASKPGATFIGSYAKAAPGYATARKETQKATEQAVSQARQARLKMLQAKDLERRGDIESADKLFNESENEMLDAGMKIHSANTQKEVARIQKTPIGRDAVIAGITAKMDKLDPESKEYKALKTKLADIEKGGVVAQMKAANTVPKFLLEKYKNVLGILKQNALMPENYGPKAAARQELQQLEDHLTSSGYDIGEIRQIAGGQSETSQPAAGGGTLIYNPQTGKIESR